FRSLGLRRELGIGHLDRNNGGQAFTGIIASCRHFLALLGTHFLIDIAIQNAGEGGPEARQVCATVALGNIVGVGEDVLLIAIIPLQSNLHRNAILWSVGIEVENLVY